MASKSAPPPDRQVKTMKRSRRRGQRQETDVQELTSSGLKALEEGRSRDAVRGFKAALQAATQLKDSRVLGACLFNLGAAYLEGGEPHKALDLLQQSHPGSKADRHPDLQFNLAIAHNALGKTQEASAAFLRAAHLYRSQGNGGSEGDACMEMSRCYSQTQDWALAARGFLRAADSYRVAAMLDSAAKALKEAGSHMIRANQFTKSDISGILGECLSLTDSISDPRTLGELFLSVGVSYCQLRCFQEAVQCFQRALMLPAQQPPLLAKVLQNLGAALNSMGQFSEAVGYHRLAGGLYGSLGCHGDRARCFSNLAHAWTQLGDEDEAVESFILSLQGFRDTEDHLAQVQVCESLAECYVRQRKHQRAAQLYQRALTALSRCTEDRAHQDPLVKRLTTALRQSLSVRAEVGVPCPLQHPPFIQATHEAHSSPQRPRPLHPAGTTPPRGGDITGGPAPEANQQSLHFSAKRPKDGGGDPRLSADGAGTPGPHSSRPPRRPHTPDPPDDPGTPACTPGMGVQVPSRGGRPTGDASLAQQAESPPTSQADSSETTPPRVQGEVSVLFTYVGLDSEWTPHSGGVSPQGPMRMTGNRSSLSPPTSSAAPAHLNSSLYPPTPDWEPPSFSQAAQFRVGAIFILFLFAACSNMALLTSVWCGRGRRLASHLRPLMLSLASADLMMTFVVMPLDAAWNVTVQWYGGDALCKLLSFLKLFAMHASAFILVVISLDRQHAILHPLDALSAHRRNRFMLLLAWTLSLLLASPQLFIFRTIRVDRANFTQCVSHGSFRHRWQETVYNMFHFITLYVVPLLVMSCCYSRILLHIHQKHLRDKAGESHLRRSGTDIIPKARMKTLKMSVIIVLSFVVCWTPYYLLGIWYWFQPGMVLVTPEYVHHVLFVFGNLNTCCDPVIYGFYTPSFRADLAACCRWSQESSSPLSLNRLSTRRGPHSGEHEPR